jgi:hypothetical protein
MTGWGNDDEGCSPCCATRWRSSGRYPPGSWRRARRPSRGGRSTPSSRRWPTTRWPTPRLWPGRPGADRAAIRELTFAFRDATVHVQIARASLHGGSCRLGPARSRSTSRAGRRGGQVDEQGWFSFAPLPHALPPGVAAGGRRPAMTDWLTLDRPRLRAASRPRAAGPGWSRRSR